MGSCHFMRQLVGLIGLVVLVLLGQCNSSAPNSAAAGEAPTHTALQIHIENSREDFHPSTLDSYFPVVLSNENIVYCQNLRASSEGNRHQKHSSSSSSSSHSLQQSVKKSLRRLFPRTDQKCTFLMAGWWVYEFCFQKHVRQFHQEQDQTVTMEFFLGHGSISPRESSDASTDSFHEFFLDWDEPQNSYISYLFTNGTKCDLTGQPRSVEVRFYCNSEQPAVDNYFGHVEEPESCSYLAKYYMKQLCDFDGFGKKEEKIERMQCLEKSEFEAFLREQEEKGTAQEEPAPADSEEEKEEQVSEEPEVPEKKEEFDDEEDYEQREL